MFYAMSARESIITKTFCAFSLCSKKTFCWELPEKWIIYVKHQLFLISPTELWAQKTQKNSRAMPSRKRYSLTLGDDLFEPINLSKKRRKNYLPKNFLRWFLSSQGLIKRDVTNVWEVSDQLVGKTLWLSKWTFRWKLK